MSNPRPLRPFRVVLTGGIASGKSIVANLFTELGVPVIDTDQIARVVVEPGSPALKEIVAHFGRDVLDDSGVLNRRRMRERVFENEADRRLLESILHPAIRAEQERLSAKLTYPYQIHVVPLLVESGTAGRYDRILVVDCPRQLQLQRMLARDNIELELAIRILDSQASRQQRLAVADDVLENSDSLIEVAARVNSLHEKYLSLASRLERYADR